MAKQQTVTVVHPELKDTDGSAVEAHVLPASVKLYVRKGWNLKEESLEREGNEAPLTDADKAQLKLAAGDQDEPSKKESSSPVEVIEPGTAGQPGENGNSGESPDSRRRGR